jgi:hypothetical protein
MDFFSRIFGWERGTVCDICNRHTSHEESYLLTTTQVVSSLGYWQDMLIKNPQIHNHDPEGAHWAFAVAKVCEYRTPWQLCEQCMTLFDSVNKDLARQYSVKNSRPPGTGPANKTLGAIPAAHAWVKLYGFFPSSIIGR